MAGLAGAPAGKGPAPSKGPVNIPPVQVPHSTPAPAHPAAAPNPLAALGVGGGLTGQQLYNAAATLASTKYDPSISQLAGQIASQNATAANATKLTSGYFNGLNAMANQSIANEGQISQGLNSTLAGIGNSAQSQINGIGNAQQQELATYAPQGTNIMADAGVTNQLASAIAEQKGLAIQQAAAMKGTGAVQGSDWQQYANALKGSDAQLGKQELTAINTGNAAKVAPLNQKIGTLEGERENYLLGQFDTLRNQEVRNQQGAAKLGIDQYNAETTRQHDQATTRIGQENANTNMSKAAWTQYYQSGLLGATLKKLGISAQTAATAAYNAQTHRINTEGTLQVARERAGTQRTQVLGNLQDARVRLQIQKMNTQVAAERVGLQGKYDQNRTAQGWAALSEKQRHDLATEATAAARVNLEYGRNGGTKPLTTGQNNTLTLLLNEAGNYIRQQKNPKLGSPQRDTLNRALAGGISESQPIQTALGVGHSSTHIPAINPVLITAAHDLIDHGTISRATAQAMSQMGMRGTTFGGKPIRIKG